MNVLTVIKDVVGVLLLAFLLPVWMVLGLGAVAVVATRQLYWWARGNTTAVSRSAERVSWPPLHARTRDPIATVVDASPAGARAAGVLSPAVPGVSQR